MQSPSQVLPVRGPAPKCPVYWKTRPAFQCAGGWPLQSFGQRSQPPKILGGCQILLPAGRENVHDESSTWEQRTVGVMASEGSGSRISTFVAEERSLNCDLALTRYSVRLLLCFSTVHSTQMSGFTFWLRR